MGRPPTRPKGLKDGFYIEVRNKRSSISVKLRSDTLAEMQQSIEHYKATKDVVVLGEHKNGEWVDQQDGTTKKKRK